MKNWLLYSPFSKHSFWNKITEQLNKTDQIGQAKFSDLQYYVSINETEPTIGKRGVYLSSWSKQDSQFMLDINSETQELVVIRPNNNEVNENPFKRTVDTEQIAYWLEHYEWVAFGYIIVPEGVNKFQAMERSMYYTRDTQGTFISLSGNCSVKEEIFQPVQHWFVATKATDDLIIVFCHPDILIPNFGIDYQTDKNNNTYFTYLEETFNYFDIALAPKISNAIITDGVIYSNNEYIDIEWSSNSLLSNTVGSIIKPIIPTNIITEIPYEPVDNGIKIKNLKGAITLKYTVSSLLSPSMKVSELGNIKKTYIILGE